MDDSYIFKLSFGWEALIVAPYLSQKINIGDIWKYDSWFQPQLSPYPLQFTFCQKIEGQHAQPAAACVNGSPGPLQQGGRVRQGLSKARKNRLRGDSCVHGVGLTLVGC